MSWHLQQGVYATSHYSGTGFAEMSSHALGSCLHKDYGYPECPVQNIECCDKIKSCRAQLMNFEGQAEFKHVFGNIFDRLPDVVKAKLDLLVWPSKQAVLAMSAEETTAMVTDLIKSSLDLMPPSVFAGSTSKCDRHKKMCPTQDVPQTVLDGEQGLGAWAGMRMNTAGITCLDLTQWGDMLDLAGPHTKTLLVWVAERLAAQEPILVIECVVNEILKKFLEATLGRIYDFDWVDMCPSDLGHPTTRCRTWGVGAHRDCFIRTSSLEQMKIASCFHVHVFSSTNQANDTEPSQWQHSLFSPITLWLGEND
jgi:hypothetical protein